MKIFACSCANRLFFENTTCLRCKKTLGFDPESLQLLPLNNEKRGLWAPDQHTLFGDGRFRRCKNTLDYNVCNWLIPEYDQHSYCIACRMNEKIPSLTKAENHDLWASMEVSKHRLLYTLLSLGLPVIPKSDAPSKGLAFAFLEDKRTNQNVRHEHVLTGHTAGLITVNLNEADNAFREATRKEFGESYRTLLGHFRHESGHYYWDLLIKGTSIIEPFRELFGDERKDYQQALKQYHSNPVVMNEKRGYISNYAQVHPYEDWAETWAHYLHMVDTLETAASFGQIKFTEEKLGFDEMMALWVELSIMMNSLNRSMGFYDAYPFILTSKIKKKIYFVHQLLSHVPSTTLSSVNQGRLS